jgi:hypothetical protein
MEYVVIALYYLVLVPIAMIVGFIEGYIILLFRWLIGIGDRYNYYYIDENGEKQFNNKLIFPSIDDTFDVLGVNGLWILSMINMIILLYISNQWVWLKELLINIINMVG